MSSYLCVDFDDFGIDCVISDQCQTRDCRSELHELKDRNPRFKVTLFAVPDKMSDELLMWAESQKKWVELAVHGWTHSSNYECENWTEEECEKAITHPMVRDFFVKGFKAPGWQISDGCYRALLKHGFWVGDQDYNDSRRPPELPVYKVGENSLHGHTWNCVGNGIQERFKETMNKVVATEEFKFISEVV